MVRRIVALVLLCGAGRTAGGVSVAADKGGYTVRCVTDTFYTAEAVHGGTVYDEVRILGQACTPVPGEPRLPVLTGMLALPDAHTTVSGRVEAVASSLHRIGRVLPNPERMLPADGDGEPSYGYHETAAAYRDGTPYPAEPLHWETVTVRDSVYLVYRYCPFRWNPADGTIRFVREAVLRFDVHTPLARVAAAAADTGTADRWFNHGDSWYRIPVGRSGLRKITHAQLAAAGTVPDSAGLAYMGLYHRGRPVPLHITGGDDGTFDAGDALLFYADAEPDTVVQCRHYTDTAVYWLKTGGTVPGARMGEDDGTSTGGAQVADVPFALHLEQDRITYTNRLDAVTLKYFWRLLAYPPAEAVIPAAIPDPAGVDSIDIAVRFRGMTSVSGTNPDHHLTFSLNGTTLPELYTDGDGVITYRARAAAGVLRPGTDTLRIALPGDTQAGEVDALYLDWVRIEGRTRPAASAGGVTVRLPAHPDSATYAVTVESLATAGAYVFNHGTGALVAGTSDSAASGNCSFSFSVPADTPVTVTVASYDIVDTVASLAPVMFRGIAADEGDYIIITQPALAAQAARMHTLRAADGLTPVTVFFDDIVNEYNYGVFNPEAIHTYLQDAWDTWSLRPKYVLILGDASWDYKRAEYDRPNVVPSVGNPANDNFFACVSGDDYLPDLYLGRLPAADADEAAVMVDKIIAYEADSSGGAWRGSYVFLNGGQTAQEQASFASNTRTIIRESVTAGSAYVCTTVISKQLDDCVWDENRDTILAAMNRGALWTNFAGHGGSWTWDCMFSHNNVAQLTNRGMLPFITSMTCHTGRFAEPGLECFGESFLESGPDGGVAFFGTTGWGYILGDYYLSRYLFRAALQRGYTDLGRAVADAKAALFASFGGTYRELVEFYSLLGDPAMRLKTVDAPDFAVVPGSFTVTPEQPFEHTPVTLAFSAANYGRACTSAVRADIYYDMPGQAQNLVASVSVPPESLFTRQHVAWTPPAGKRDYTLYLVLDGTDAVAEWDERNNSDTVSVEIFSEPLVNCAPFNKAVTASRVPALVSITGSWSADSLDYYFELDTIPACTSAGVRRSGVIRTDANRAVYVPDSLQPGRTYFWRTRLFNGVSYSRWSVPMSFAVDTAAAGGLWRETDARQFASDSTDAVAAGAAGVVLARTVDSVDCAHLDRGASVPYVSSKTSHTDARNLVGGAFDVTVASEAENFIFGVQDSFQLAVIDLGQVRSLRRIASRHYGGKGDREVWSYFAVSTSVDSQEFVTWGALGPFATPDNNIADSVVVQSDTATDARYIRFNYGLNSPDYGGSGARIVETYAYRGRYAAAGRLVSSPVGPAVRWDSLAWGTAGDTSGAVTVTVEGRNRGTGAWEPVMAGSTAAANGLGGIDARTYPYLRLAADLATGDRFASPSLNDWSVTCRPAAELVITSLTVSADTAVPGDTLRATAVVLNTGAADAGSCTVAFRCAAAAVDSAYTGQRRFVYGVPETLHTRCVPGTTGAATFTLTVNADSAVTELWYGNNTASVSVPVVRRSGMMRYPVSEFVSACRTHPVPARDAVVTSFRVNRPGTVHLSVFTADGREILARSRFCGAGTHTFAWTAADIAPACRGGVLFVRVGSAGSTAWSTTVFTR